MVIPTGKFLYLKPDEAPVKYSSIIIPDHLRQKPGTGLVVALSPDWNFEVRIGDRVAYEPNAGSTIEGTLLAITEDQLMYIL